MEQGKIKTIKRDKKFGFITPAQGRSRDGDLFFHASAVEGPIRFDDLTEGQTVGFERGNQSGKGPRAECVRADVAGE